MAKANVSDDAQTRGKSGTHTFGEIGGKILVQLVKVGFGDDDGIQRRVDSILVRRALWLEGAALIAGDSRIGGGGWGRGCAGSAGRPLHDRVHRACGGEEGRGRVGGTMEGKADEMRRPFSVNTLASAPIGDSMKLNAAMDSRGSLSPAPCFQNVSASLKTYV